MAGSLRYGIVRLLARMAGTSLAMPRVDQLFEDAAVGDAVAACALGIKSSEPLLKLLQGCAFHAHPREVLMNQTVDLVAGHRPVLGQLDEPLYVCKCHVERPAMADEDQTIEVLGRVRPISRGGSGGRLNEPLALVIAHRLDIHPGLSSEFTYAHRGLSNK